MQVHHAKRDGAGDPGVKAADPAVSTQPRLDADRIALERSADKAHLAWLVAGVASQLLAVPLPALGSDAAAMEAWAVDRARNILQGLVGERL
jgi:hypothetical protein